MSSVSDIRPSLVDPRLYARARMRIGSHSRFVAAACSLFAPLRDATLYVNRLPLVSVRHFASLCSRFHYFTFRALSRCPTPHPPVLLLFPLPHLRPLPSPSPFLFPSRRALA